MNLKFTEEYYPLLEELTDAQIAAAREKIVAELQPLMPEVDMSPGTPTGDLVISPLAAYRAAAEEANSRLMSDLDLSNVASGLIYSCDFVKAYLGNFAVYDVENLRAFGLARLTFTSSDALTLARSLRFQFGTSDTWEIQVSDETIEEITILEPGSEHTGAADTYILGQTSATTWAVDIPLQGTLSGPVVAGTAGSVNETVDDLSGVSAAISFLSGVPSASLRDLAAMARKIAFSLTAGSRNSTSSLVFRNWPETTMVSPIVPGDPEMQRVAAGSAIALQEPAMDLYVRSSRDLQREVQSVRLDYVLPDGGASKVFRGALPLLHRPSRVIDFEWSGATSTSRVDSVSIYSRPTRSDLYGSLHCGTRHESLYAEVVPTETGGVSDIPLTDDPATGGQYAIFTLSYDADPLLESMSSLLESPDYRPAGVDLLVKSGPLVLIDSLNVIYAKQNGVKMTLSVARDKIVDYVESAGHPEPFAVTEIYDIMRNAGASRVLSLEAVGRVFVSSADRLFRNTITDPAGDDLTADWETESDLMQVYPFIKVEDITPNFLIDGEISEGGPPDAWAATPRTVRYAVDDDAIKFVETAS